MIEYYIIKRTTLSTGDFMYYLSGHSQLSMNNKPKSISKYYVWNKEGSAKSAMTRLMKQYDDYTKGYKWEVCTLSEEDIEVK